MRVRLYVNNVLQKVKLGRHKQFIFSLKVFTQLGATHNKSWDFTQPKPGAVVQIG